LRNDSYSFTQVSLNRPFPRNLTLSNNPRSRKFVVQFSSQNSKSYCQLSQFVKIWNKNDFEKDMSISYQTSECDFLNQKKFLRIGWCKLRSCQRTSS
jgi:aryl-phospho-beta-D-glucosidase BglC (GH1 family)